MDKLTFKLEEKVINAALRGLGGVDSGTERLDVEISGIRHVCGTDQFKGQGDILELLLSKGRWVDATSHHSH